MSAMISGLMKIKFFFQKAVSKVAGYVESVVIPRVYTTEMFN